MDEKDKELRKLRPEVIQSMQGAVLRPEEQRALEAERDKAAYQRAESNRRLRMIENDPEEQARIADQFRREEMARHEEETRPSMDQEIRNQLIKEMMIKQEQERTKQMQQGLPVQDFKLPSPQTNDETPLEKAQRFERMNKYLGK